MNTFDLNELQQRTCFDEIVPNYNEVEGFVLGCGYKKAKTSIDNFEVLDSDIWVCTYPKSGTTWTQEMTWLIANDFDYEGAKQIQSDRFPMLETESLFNNEELAKFREVHCRQSNSVEFVKNLKTQPRFIKCHLPWILLPNQIKTKEKRPKIIYVLRDPKDVCVSFYYLYINLFSYTGTFEEFCTLFLNDKILYTPYWKQVESYWMQRNESNVLILKYAHMKKDLKSQVLKIAKFLNKTIPDCEMERFLNHLSLDSMKKNNATNLRFVRPKQLSDKDLLIRKGIIGDYKNHMTPEIINKFNKWITDNNKQQISFE